LAVTILFLRNPIFSVAIVVGRVGLRLRGGGLWYRLGSRRCGRTRRRARLRRGLGGLFATAAARGRVGRAGSRVEAACREARGLERKGLPPTVLRTLQEHGIRGL